MRKKLTIILIISYIIVLYIYSIYNYNDLQNSIVSNNNKDLQNNIVSNNNYNELTKKFNILQSDLITLQQEIYKDDIKKAIELLSKEYNQHKVYYNFNWIDKDWNIKIYYYDLYATYYTVNVATNTIFIN